MTTLKHTLRALLLPILLVLGLLALTMGGAQAISYTVAPTPIPQNHTSPITLTLTGTGTAWSGATVFTVTNNTAGTTAVTILSATNVSATSETLRVVTGAGSGTYTLSDGTTTQTAGTTIITAGANPTGIIAGTAQAINFTESSGGLLSTDQPNFTLSGVTGASLTNLAYTSGTAATATLNTTAGPGGTLYITDPATGAAASLLILPSSANSGTGVAPNTVSGLKLWLKADSITAQANASSLTPTSWADSSGNGFGPTTGTATYINAANGQNGLPFVRFNGSSDHLTLSSTSIPFVGGGTWFIVARVNSATQNAGVMSMADGTNADYTTGNTAMLWNTGSQGGAPTGSDYRWGGNVSAVNVPIQYQNQWCIIEGQSNALGSQFDKNGCNVGLTVLPNGVILGRPSAAATASITPTMYSIGSRIAAGGTFNGYSQVDVGEVALYSGSLSQYQRTQIRSYLASRWGIACPGISAGVTDANFYASPYNWYSDGGGNISTNDVTAGSTYVMSSSCGAYIKTAFTGTSFALPIDTDTLTAIGAQNASQMPYLSYAVDGGAWTRVPESPNFAVQPMASGLTSGTHQLDIMYSGRLVFQDWWPVGYSGVKILGLNLDTAAATATRGGVSGASGAYDISSSNVLLFTDSIGEGEQQFSASQSNFNGVAEESYPWLFGRGIGAEDGTVSYGGDGYATSGVVGRPPLVNTATGQSANNTWSQYFNGFSRLYTLAGVPGGIYLYPQPNVILLGMGTNGTIDAGQSADPANMYAAFNAIHAAAPNAQIYQIVPWKFGQSSTLASNAASFAASNPWLHVLDPNTSPGFPELGGLVRQTKLSFDATHPNQAGQPVVSARLLSDYRKATATSGTKRKVQ